MPGGREQYLCLCDADVKALMHRWRRQVNAYESVSAYTDRLCESGLRSEVFEAATIVSQVRL